MATTSAQLEKTNVYIIGDSCSTILPFPDLELDNHEPAEFCEPALMTKRVTLRPYFAGLLKREPSQTVKNEELSAAAAEGDLDAVTHLLETGAEADAINNEPLLEAAANGHLEIVALLIRKGADVHARNDAALTLAIRYRHAETVRLLSSGNQDHRRLAL